MLRSTVTPLLDLIVAHPDGLGQDSAEGAGLVQSHISHRSPDAAISVTVYCDLLKVRRFGEQPLGGGIRGKVAGFSRASRKRFLEKMAMCRNIGVGVFATLTYPDQFPRDPEKWKRQIDSLQKRLVRKFEQSGGFWRMEMMRRKSGENKGGIAPHFHLILTGVPGSIVAFREWLAQAWYEIVNSGDERHLAAGTQADVINNRAHAMRYASKYAAKLDDESDQEVTDANSWAAMHVGRFWGCFGDLDFTETAIFIMDERQYIEFKRMVLRWLLSRGRKRGSKFRKFLRRTARNGIKVGVSAFGLGSQSCELWRRLESTTAWRMLQVIQAPLIVNYSVGAA